MKDGAQGDYVVFGTETGDLHEHQASKIVADQRCSNDVRCVGNDRGSRRNRQDRSRLHRLTGGIAHLGKDNESGARLAVEEINAKGLDDQRPEGHALGPRPARRRSRPAYRPHKSRRKLVDYKVVAVIGHLNCGHVDPGIRRSTSDAGIVPRSRRRPRTRPTRSQGFKTTYRVVVDRCRTGVRPARPTTRPSS